MPTYVKPVEELGGVFDKGPGYLALMEWYDYATGGYNGDIQYGIPFTAGTDPQPDWVGTVHLTPNQHREFHYRFIPVPNPLILNNPPYDTPIEWRLWNTFPLDDTALTANIVGSNVVTSDFNVGTELWDFEYKQLNVQIAEGEVEIDADLNGGFTQGNFTLDIVGVVVLSIDYPMLDDSVREKWTWNTKVMTSWDSTEQRVRYLPAPRRQIQAEYDMDEQELIQLQYRLFRSSVGTLAIPYHHYEFFLTQTSLINTNRIFFDPTTTNLKAGDRLYIVDDPITITIQPLIVTIANMEVDGCTITSNLPRQLEVDWVGCPLYSVFTDNPQLTAESVTGGFNLSGEVVERNRTLTRDDVATTLTLFNGLPVLDYKVLSGIREGYEIEFQDLSTPIGRRERSVIWERPKLLRNVAFRVNNKQGLSDYDYACLFFDYCAGQHKPFYISSRLTDLTLDTPPLNGSSVLEVDRTDYADGYFASLTYRQLEITFADGTVIWYNVNTAVPQLGGTTLITLEVALPADVETNVITKISYLYRVRLATDEVNVFFKNNRINFEFSILGTEQ